MTVQYFSELVQRFQWEGKYQIYIASAESPYFEFLEGREERVQLPFKRLTTQQQDVVKIVNGYTFILFTYPHDYQILINVYEYSPSKEAEIVVLYHYMYPYYTKAAIEREKYKLEKVIESTGRASSSLNPEEIYNNILSYALDVIPQCDIGTLWWYDAERDLLICKASVGNVLQGIRHMGFKRGEGPIGYTFQTEQSLLYYQHQYELWQRFGRISEENNRHWDSNYEFNKEVKSFLTCPIKVNDRVEGVMFLCQIVKPIAPTEHDLQLLEGFSSQVGIAIRNARQYSHIKKLNDKLMKRDEIHTTLTKLSMQNMGIPKILEEMTRMIGKHLIFVDLLENEVIPAMRKLPNYLSFNDLNEVLQANEAMPYYELKRSGYMTHIMYPIRLGQIILGCIIMEVKGEMSQLESIVIEQGHSVLALELSRKQNLAEFYYKKKRDAFNEMMNTKEQEIIVQKAKELMISLNEPYMVILLKLAEEVSPHEIEAYVHKLMSQMKRDLFSYAQLLFADYATITLVARATQGEEKRVRKELKRVCTEWNKKINAPLSCGVSTVYHDLYTIRKAYHEAKTVLSYLDSRKQHGMMDYAEIGVNRLFIHQDQQEIGRFIAEVFTPLETQQSMNNALKETLLMYFAQNRSATKTAKMLHIHINTLYQRLKKIEEILQISFEDAEHVLKLQLACYLKQSYQ
ncbi:helix-turn-helix domain-containing protein [Lysinibacillus sp. LZ02]|uniref:helix-turn-helix domain-containing protein n=1 Tax=Lysinibacillus sp. LZ02 TaxID=3420668 RepID=UPI003D35F54A